MKKIYEIGILAIADKLVLLGALLAIGYNKGVHEKPESVSSVLKKVYRDEATDEEISIAITANDPTFVLDELIAEYYGGKT